jgi:hypothetical protein
VIDEDKVREVAFQAAGAAAGVFLKKYPDEVMPTEEISDRVDDVLNEHGIKTYEEVRQGA